METNFFEFVVDIGFVIDFVLLLNSVSRIQNEYNSEWMNFWNIHSKESIGVKGFNLDFITFKCKKLILGMSM